MKMAEKERVRINDFKNLSNQQVVKNLDQLAKENKFIDVQILKYLNELDDRKLHLEMGHSSLFSYMRERLKYSESASYRRIHGARCCRIFPVLYFHLENGNLSLSHINLLAPTLLERKINNLIDKDELIRNCLNKTKREVEKILFKTINSHSKENSAIPIQSQDCSPLFNSQVSTDPQPEGSKMGREISTPGNPPADLNSNNPNPSFPPNLLKFRKMTIQMNPELDDKWHEMRERLSNKWPKGASNEDILDAILTLVLEKRGNKSSKISRVKLKERENIKKKDTEKAVASKSVGTHEEIKKDLGPKKKMKDRSRYIPVQVEAEVRQRAQGQCEVIGKEGKRCSSRWNLQMDHKYLYCWGGEHTVENLRLVCWEHNIWWAEKLLGNEVIGQFSALKFKVPRNVEGGGTSPGSSS